MLNRFPRVVHQGFRNKKKKKRNERSERKKSTLWTASHIKTFIHFVSWPVSEGPKKNTIAHHLFIRTEAIAGGQEVRERLDEVERKSM